MTPTATMEPPVVVVPVEVVPIEHRGVLATLGDSINRMATAVRVRMARLWAWIQLKARNGWARVKLGWSWTKAKVTKMASWVKEKAQVVWTKVKKTVKGFFGWLWSKIKTVWEWVKEKTVKVWNWACSKASTVWDWVCAKAPVVGNKVMSAVGWLGARFAQLGTAAKVGVMAGTSVALAVLAHPVFWVAAVLLVATMIISHPTKPKAKRERVTLPQEQVDAMHARLTELQKQHEDAIVVADVKVGSELRGRIELIKWRMRYGFKDSARTISTHLKKETIAELADGDALSRSAAAAGVDWVVFAKGVQAESANWAEVKTGQVFTPVLPVIS